MKKFLPIFAALLIALFAVACGGGEDLAGGFLEFREVFAGCFAGGQGGDFFGL